MAGVPRGGVGRLARALAPSLGSASTSLMGAIIVIYLAIALTTPGGLSWWSPSRATAQMIGRLGAKWTPLILAGEWWRLVNPIYLHWSLSHILFNAYALASLGPTLELAVGGRRLLVLFTLTGVFSFVVSMFVLPGTLAAGASGALFGLIGFGAVHGRLRGGVFRAFSQDLMRWAVFGLALSILPGIDWSAHAGGLAAGAFLGLFVGLRAPRSRLVDRLWTIAAVVCALLPVVGFLLALTSQMNSAQ